MLSMTSTTSTLNKNNSPRDRISLRKLSKVRKYVLKICLKPQVSITISRKIQSKTYTSLQKVSKYQDLSIA